MSHLLRLHCCLDSTPFHASELQRSAPEVCWSGLVLTPLPQHFNQYLHCTTSHRAITACLGGLHPAQPSMPLSEQSVWRGAGSPPRLQ